MKRLYAKEDFDVLESLGEGFFGDVFKVRESDVFKFNIFIRSLFFASHFLTVRKISGSLVFWKRVVYFPWHLNCNFYIFFKVKHRITGEVMVLKVGKDRERENRSRAKASVLKEVSVLNQLTEHPNLLAFR